MIGFAASSTLAVLVAASQPTSVVGTVRVTKAVGGPDVSVRTDAGSETKLVGDLAREVQSLQSAKVEALGILEDGKLLVQDYRILELSGGAKAVMGVLVETAAGIAIQDGDGAPLVLDVTPKLKQKLMQKVAAKVWVSGETTLAGQLKVTRFGVLREAVRAASKADDEAAPLQ